MTSTIILVIIIMVLVVAMVMMLILMIIGIFKVFHLLRQDGPGVISDSVDVPEMARTKLTRMMVVWLMPVVLNKKKLYSNFYHNSSVVYNITTELTIKLFLLLF